MSDEIRKLEPKAVWNNFADLNQVPRASKKEERVIKFMVRFGNSLGLDTHEDAIGNVIVKKPATPGMEDRKTVILQAHLDMVHQKNNDTVFDFDKEGIRMYRDGDWVRAEGTTLGADNGLGVAAIMAILQSDEVEHPALEALFTIDEETGMTGAKHLSDKILTGEILLNLDTEEDDEIGIGCAGGIDITATKTYKPENPKKNSKAFLIKLKGLQGGHSGMDIIKGLGNANKLMNRMLYNAFSEQKFQIASINGGGLRNAIPRESEVVVVIEDPEAFKNSVEKTATHIKEEYGSLEENLLITVEATDLPDEVMSSAESKNLLNTVYAAHDGVYRMSPDVPGLVEASNNLAQVEVASGKVSLLCLTRSSVESGKADLTNGMTAAFELGGFEVVASGAYPGWRPNPNSEILKVLEKVYVEQNKENPTVAAYHAGLECGILLSHYPDLDTISFGPTIKGAHSPDERASIRSTQKFWKFLVEILRRIPQKEEVDG